MCVVCVYFLNLLNNIVDNIYNIDANYMRIDLIYNKSLYYDNA